MHAVMCGSLAAMFWLGVPVNERHFSLGVPVHWTDDLPFEYFPISLVDLAELNVDGKPHLSSLRLRGDPKAQRDAQGGGCRSWGIAS
jgi:hypothetical protein